MAMTWFRQIFNKVLRLQLTLDTIVHKILRKFIDLSWRKHACLICGSSTMYMPSQAGFVWRARDCRVLTKLSPPIHLPNYKFIVIRLSLFSSHREITQLAIHLLLQVCPCIYLKETKWELKLPLARSLSLKDTARADLVMPGYLPYRELALKKTSIFSLKILQRKINSHSRVSKNV